MIQSILEKLKGKEEVELKSIEDAEKVFKQERGREIENIRDRIDEFQDKTDKVLDSLDDALESVEGFEDEKDRAVIEDVVSNVVEDRRNLISRFETSEDIERLRENLESFLAEYQGISRKEGAVIEEAGLEQRFGETLKQVKTLHQEVEDFIENDYKTLKNFKQLKKHLNQLQDFKEEIKQKKKDIEEIELGETKQELESKEEELEEYLEGSEMSDYRGLEQRLEEAEEERDRIEGRVVKAMSSMERGLKKLLYEGEIGKVSKQGSDILREIRDQEKEKIMHSDPEQVEDAVESVKKSLGDKLEDKTRKKLLQGLETFQEFQEVQKKLNDLNDEISELEENISEHSALEKKQRLENEKENLENKIGEKEDKLEELKQELDEVEGRKDRIEKQVLTVLEDEFDKIELLEEEN
jgi:chromosome segregation ATPase